MSEVETLKVALAGNPNSGKTSLFNVLTGSRQHVGNYAGVTVERRLGRFKHDGQRFEVEDLPGTYSLGSYSPEERIAQDALTRMSTRAHVVVVVVDSTALRRSLVILAQVMQADANPVLCLNMADEAHAAGQQLDLDLLRSLLGFPVVETVGSRGLGVQQLKEAIHRAALAPVVGSDRLVLGQQLDDALEQVRRSMARDPDVPASWAATRLLIQDTEHEARARQQGALGARALEVAAQQRARLEADTGMDAALFVTHRFHGFVDGLLREALTRAPRADARALSDRIDAIVVNRVLGIPIFLAVMYGIFWLTFTVGEIPMGWIQAGFVLLAEQISALWPAGSSSALRSLLVDGIIGGVGGVVVFLPNIVLLFLGLALLEDTGYMARAAFIMDRLMHVFGLHGRSFIPMVTGFGCSIPGIMATRTMENERDRLATMLVLPLMSCGARLPIWMLIIPAFFAPPWRAPMLWMIYTVGIGLALVLALVLRSTLLRGEEAPFVMELPPYRLPTARAVMTKMTERSWIYLRKAGTVILALSILMWFATAYPKAGAYRVDARVASGQVRVVERAPGEQTGAHGKVRLAAVARSTSSTDRPVRTDASPPNPSGDVEQITSAQLRKRRAAEDLEASAAGRVGRALEPVMRPLGFDWKITTAMIGAFAAKEVFVAQMGIVHSLGEVGQESTDLRQVLRRDYTPLTGVSLMLFLLIATPCMATLAVTRRESGSWKWALLQLSGLTAVAYLVSLVFYQVGRLFA